MRQTFPFGYSKSSQFSTSFNLQNMFLTFYSEMKARSILNQNFQFQGLNITVIKLLYELLFHKFLTGMFQSN